MRGWFGWLRALLFGLAAEVPDSGQQQSLYQCLHPRKAWTACTYQLGPKGKYAWLMRCRQCGAWFAC